MAITHVYALQKTDNICDIDQVLCVLREIPGVVSATLMEGAPRVVITSDEQVTLEALNAALAAKVPCRLESGTILPE